MVKRQLGAVVLLITAAFMTGCGERTIQGTAARQANPASSGAVPPERLLAPPVPAPLKYQGFHNAQNICLIINVAQANKIGLTQPKVQSKEDSPDETGCAYVDRASRNAFAIDFQNKISNGLSGIYAQRPKMWYWQPTQVQGYPAVLASIGDDRTNGNCAMFLGVTDQEVVKVGYYSGPDPSRTLACSKSLQVASEVITSLKRQH